MKRWSPNSQQGWMNLPRIMRKLVFRLLPCHAKLIIVVLIISIIIIMFTPVIRNIVLFPVWPYAWRELSTFDAIELRFFTQHTLDVEAVASCPTTTMPRITPSNVDMTNVKTYSQIDFSQLHSPEHKRYLPSITPEDKLKLLYTYIILDEALRTMRVEFFFVQGSLLGVHRHKGLIPWDDDIDIAVNVSDWKLVRHGLSCIEGFVLSVTNFMHWKFHSNTSHPYVGYPFIDIFFYTENDHFIWAVSKSTSYYLVFPKKDTFPLTHGQYEGLTVPVPKNTDGVLKVLYDYEICQSRGMDHKTHAVMSWSEVSSIPCSSLTYLYDMYNFASS